MRASGAPSLKKLVIYPSEKLWSSGDRWIMSSLSFCLVHRAKRMRHANDHMHD